jgi:hypothetical protein
MDATALVAARVTNLIARRVPSVSRKATARQAQKFRLSAGRKGKHAGGEAGIPARRGWPIER